MPQNNKGHFGAKSQRAKGLLADGQEATALIPAAPAPAEVQLAPAAPVVEAGRTRAAVTVQPNGAEGDDGEFLLLFGIGGAEGERALCGSGFETATVKLVENLLGACVFAEMEKNEVFRYFTAAFDGKVLLVDVAVYPVVIAGPNHFGKRH